MGGSKKKPKRDAREDKNPTWPKMPFLAISSWRGLFVIWCLCCALLFTSRYPTFFYPQAYNPDEAQFASAAISAAANPIPYETWDPSTSGPLNIFPLLLPLAVGHEITLSSGRIIATLTLALVATLIFAFLAKTIGTAAALVGTIPFMAFHCTTANPDFVHYSSEMVPNAFLALGVFLTSFQFGKPPRLILAIVSGAAFACAPLAKWQTGPLAVWLFLVSCGLAAWRVDEAKQKLRIFISYSIGGFLTAFIAFLIIVIPGNADFFQAVVFELGTAYAGMKSPSLMDRIMMIYGITLSGEAFLSMLIGVGLAICFLFILGMFLRSQNPKLQKQTSEKTGLQSFILMLAWFAGSVGTLFSTGRDYLHYLLLVAPPASAIVGYVFFWATEKQSNRWIFTYALIVVLALVWSFYHVIYSSPKNFIYNSPEIFSHSSKVLNQFKNDGDKLALWGCYSEVFVETNMPYGVRSYSVFTMGNIPEENTNWFKKEYIDFFKKNKPEWFLDATIPSLESMIGQQLNEKRHESFPELKEEIDQNYQFITRTDEGRLFLRKDVYAERKLSSEMPEGSLKELANSTSVPVGSVRRWKSQNTTSMALLPNSACIVELPKGAKYFKFEAFVPNQPFKVFTRWVFPINEYANPKILSGDNLETLGSVKDFHLNQYQKDWQQIEGELPIHQKLFVIFLPAEKTDKPVIAAIRNLEFFDSNKANVSKH
jgi:hypothetical protein